MHAPELTGVRSMTLHVRVWRFSRLSFAVLALATLGLLTACSTLIFLRLPKDADRELRR